MYLETNTKTECCGCSACVKVCPVQCISLEKDDEGFFYPLKDSDRCIRCNKCVHVCPIEKQTLKKVKSTYAGTAVDSKIVNNSSSGGVCPTIVKNFLENGAIVYAVELDKSLKVQFKRVEKEEEIVRIQGSKYVQCLLTRDVLNSIDADLKSGKRVCFVGTPCQVQAVRNVFTDKNLFTVDFVCHGVPSSYMFEKYIKNLEKKHKGKVVDLNFRNKDKYGWSITLSYDMQKNGKVKRYYLSHKMSSYFVGFLHGLTLRESCYNCKYSSVERSSDITLADFWGCDKIIPEIANKNGVSLVLVNTQAGENVINAITEQKKVVLKRIDKEVGLSQSINTNLAHPTARKEKRDTIYKDLEENGFEYVEKKYFKPLVSTRERIIARIPYSLRKAIKKIIK